MTHLYPVRIFLLLKKLSSNTGDDTASGLMNLFFIKKPEGV